MWHILIILIPALVIGSADRLMVKIPFTCDNCDLQSVINYAKKIAAVSPNVTNTTLNNIIDELFELPLKLQDLDLIIYDDDFESKINTLKLNTILRTQLSNLRKHIQLIEDMYMNSTEYLTDPDKLFNIFSTQISVENWSALHHASDRIREMMTLSEEAESRISVLKMLRREFENMSFNRLCKWSISPQQYLYRIFQTVLISRTKMFLLRMAGYINIAVHDNNTFVIYEVRQQTQMYLEEIQHYIWDFKTVIQDASSIVDICDPHLWIRGRNFLELERSMQMVIISERNILDPDGLTRCSWTCEDYKSASVDTGDENACGTHHTNPIYWCPNRPCKGQVLNCISGNVSHVNEMSYNSVRRYLWVENDYGKVFGKNEKSLSTHNDEHYRMQTHHPTYYTYGFVSCDICMCTCVEHGAYNDVIRAISLRPVLSNIKENMVVTGLKFIENNKMIQIQVQEGHLSPFGKITEKSKRWVELEEFHRAPLYRYEYIGNNRVYFQNETQMYELTENQDYVFISENRRTVYLDDLVGRHGSVVTGVKFRAVDSSLYGNGIQLVIQITKFDFSTGALSQDVDDSSWQVFGHDTSRRVYIPLTQSHNPIAKDIKHTTISGSYKYLEFQESSWIKDAGQTTLPLFDAQPNELYYNYPLSAVGLIHRGAKDSGGFLAFRFFTLDLSAYWQTS